MATVDGSSTLFKGATGGSWEASEVVMTFALKEGETVYKGQALSLDQDTNNSSDVDSLNGVVVPPTADGVALIGVCLLNVDDSDASANEYGKRRVPILMRGVALMRCIVNATGTGDGYEIPIKVGNVVNAAGADCTVSGWTSLESGAYATAQGGTDSADTYPIGWFLDSQDGHATDETISNGTVSIAASQCEDVSTWVRVYVDIFATNNTTVVNILSR